MKTDTPEKTYWVQYRSGDGESFIEQIRHYDSTTMKKGEIIKADNDLIDEIENNHHDIIFKHDHDYQSGVGYFCVVNGTVTKSVYHQDSE